MTEHTAITAVRALALERCLSGAVLLTRPATVSHRVAGGEPTPPVWLVRVLGARLLAQGIIVLIRPTRSVVLAGIMVDATHALSMIGAAAVWPTYRRSAAASAAEAAVSAVLAASLRPQLP